jgi:hypothetical protein
MSLQVWSASTETSVGAGSEPAIYRLGGYAKSRTDRAPSLFRGRQKAELAEAQQNQERAKKELDAESDRVLSEVQQQYVRVKTSEERLKIYSDGLVPQSEATFRSALSAYLKHRVIDWVSRSPFTGEFEVVIMIEGVTEEMHGSNRVPDLKRLRASLGLE